MNKTTAINLFFTAVFIAVLIPWTVVAVDMNINTNQAWWLLAAQRWLAGGTPYNDFYDTNPTWVIWIYALQVLAARATAIPVYFMPALFGVAGLMLSVAASYAVLRRFPEYGRGEKIVALAAFTTAATVMSTRIYFADRDHLVILALMPLLLAQYALTQGKEVSRRLLWPIILICGMVLLIKPHYGIFPILMVLHRMIVQKRLFSIVKDPDVLGLGFCVLSYIAAMLTIFSDFPFRILPDSLLLYIYNANVDVLSETILYAFVTIIFLVVAPLLCTERRQARILITLFGACLTCVGFFYLQKKGFYYHIIPAMGFFYVGFGLFLFYLWQNYIKRWTAAGAWIVAFGLLGFSMWILPSPKHYTSHRDYMALPYPRLIESCGPDCSYMIVSETMNIVCETALYTGKDNQSRFPTFWWLPEMAMNLQTPGKNKDTYQALRFKYAGLVAEDIQRRHPDYLFIIDNMTLSDTDTGLMLKNFDIAGFLSANPAFAERMKDYRKIGTYTMDRGAYFKDSNLDYPNPLRHDVYALKTIADKDLILNHIPVAEHETGVDEIAGEHHDADHQDLGEQNRKIPGQQP